VPKTGASKSISWWLLSSVAFSLIASGCLPGRRKTAVNDGWIDEPQTAARPAPADPAVPSDEVTGLLELMKKKEAVAPPIAEAPPPPAPPVDEAPPATVLGTNVPVAALPGMKDEPTPAEKQAAAEAEWAEKVRLAEEAAAKERARSEARARALEEFIAARKARSATPAKGVSPEALAQAVEPARRPEAEERREERAAAENERQLESFIADKTAGKKKRAVVTPEVPVKDERALAEEPMAHSSLGAIAPFEREESMIGAPRTPPAQVAALPAPAAAFPAASVVRENASPALPVEILDAGPSIDFLPEEPAAPPAPVTPRSSPPRRAGAPAMYQVVSGDTLPSVAQRLYGDAARWPDIYRANENVILRGLLSQGQWLLIP